jgi:molecular chaperone DnaK
MIYSVERSLRELGDQVSPTDRERLENLIRQLKEAMGTDNTARIRQLTQELRQAALAIGQTVYQRAAATGSSGGSRPSGEGEVVEGEYRQV